MLHTYRPFYSPPPPPPYLFAAKKISPGNETNCSPLEDYQELSLLRTFIRVATSCDTNSNYENVQPGFIAFVRLSANIFGGLTVKSSIFS